MWIYDASVKYRAAGTPLLIIAGKEYGSGSSRDWAAKGVALLGVRAVIAESFERIHRSNLIGMGVLPLEFLDGQTKDSLGLTGFESYSIIGVKAAIEGSKVAGVEAKAADGTVKTFNVKVRIDTPMEVEYYRHGGILPFVLQQLAAK
jgi:aconitate hydratase